MLDVMQPTDMLNNKLQNKLERLLHAAPELQLGADQKLVIFSDLHLGDGGGNDDFKKNGDLFLTMLRRHYLPERFTLILNGDIEELARFRLKRVMAHWRDVYGAWAEFAARGALFKLAGNHDLALLKRRSGSLPFPVSEALNIRLNGRSLFVLHGHQTSHLNWAFQTLGVLFLRWLLQPLGFGNYTVARSSRRRFRVEKRIYGFARRKKLLALIGHTHRPLFESLSRLDTLKIEIENLCRRYPQATVAEQRELEKMLAPLKQEYVQLQHIGRRRHGMENLYHDGPLLPCLFNSGCGIGRHGITAIEIAGGRVALVYWFDRRRSEKYLAREGYRPQPLADTGYFRVVLKEEGLDYIFTRINLLG
ncbi:MAG: metallophosphoesterase [Candidatus Aminicenantes bacterium]|nr:metallophosphoesterase [Candidatus Aminicenantes bacterium]